MGKPSDHPDFDHLAAEWDRRLVESGFIDAEETVGKNIENRRLIQTLNGARQGGTAYRYRTMREDQRYAKARYFQVVGQKIQETTFDSEQERQILTFYFEGFTQQEIKTKLNPPICRFTVYRKLYKWLRRWGLR